MYYYLVGDVGKRLKTLQNILTVPFGQGLPSSQARGNSETPHSGTNLWIFQQGVSIQLRYFPEYQFIMQVRGKSKWYLYPPLMYKQLKLFPFSHPCKTHSQLQIEENNNLKKSAVEIELHEGELLYIPPFWMQQMKAIEESTLIEVWSLAEEVYVLREALQNPIPVDVFWTREENIVALKVFLKSLVEKVIQRHGKRKVTLEEFVNSLLTRFKPCSKEKTPLPLYEKCLNQKYVAKKQKDWHYLFQLFVDGIGQHFHELENMHRLPQSMQYRESNIPALVLSNYVEMLISWVAGNENVQSFLCTCLS